MASVNPTILREMVNQVQISDAIATVVQKQLAEKTAQEKKVAELIPQAVEALIKNDRLPERLREKAASMLQDPVRAIEILINTAQSRNTAEATHMGDQVGGNGHSKKAAVRGSINSPYVGIRTHEDRESDQLLFERLGIR